MASFAQIIKLFRTKTTMSALPAKNESSTLQGFYGWTDTLKGVFYGPGSVTTALPKLLKNLGAKKALVVTGKSLHTKVGSAIY